MDLARVERVYSSYAGVYDAIFGKVFQQSRESAVRRLDVLPGQRVLEVGVGTGLSLALYPRHCRVVGIDISAKMLERASQQVHENGLQHIELQRGDAGSMQFPDDSFDIIVAAYVMTVVPDPRKVALEMVRVCKPGGRIVMLNHFRNRNALLGTLERALSPLFRQVGFRTDLTLETVLDGMPLTVIRRDKVKPLRMWHLVECINNKSALVARAELNAALR
jgi:phosphatidylethanolamine/phosphatidyl-N-methylethanolamine N-methyltransferase